MRCQCRRGKKQGEKKSSGEGVEGGVGLCQRRRREYGGQVYIVGEKSGRSRSERRVRWGRMGGGQVKYQRPERRFGGEREFS